jgi:hypothetical protein
MTPKSPLIASQLAYLQQVAPHRRWHYGLLLVALVAALFAVWQVFTFQDIWTVQPVTVFILSIYWFLQYRIIHTATHLAQYDWQHDVPDTLIGTLSKRTLMLTKIRALLWHHRYFVTAISLTLAILSLATMVFLYYGLGNFGDNVIPYTTARGIWKYVGTVTSGYLWQTWHWQGVYIPKSFAYIIMTSPVILTLTHTNSLLSVSIGLWAGRFGRALISRILVVGLIFGVFLGFYALRETPAWTCHRSWMIPDRCSEMLFQMRLVDSIQAFALTFLDGGTAVATGMFEPQSYTSTLDPFQIRHTAIVIVTSMSQFALSGFFLRRASLHPRKKKAVSS